MLDTQTGRLWQIVETKDGGTCLQAVPYLLTGGKYSLEARSEENELKLTPEEVRDPKIYEQLAEKYAEEGNKELEKKARAKAEELRKNP